MMRSRSKLSAVSRRGLMIGTGAMAATGFGLYPISPSGDGHGSIRLVTSFNSDPADVDTLVAAAQGA